MTFQRHRLDNGLEIVAEVIPQAYSAGFAWFVGTGARDEQDAESGVSHFLEHMAFKGTARRSAEDVNRELDEIGSHANAYTSEEETVYYAAVLPEFQPRVVDILSDMMRPALRDDDFQVEQKVILEEIKKYDDEPPYGAFDKVKALHFGRHPLARSVLGTTESVSGLTPEMMRDYFRRRYSPGNMTFVAAGRVDFDQLVADIERYCGEWEPVESGRATPPVERHGGIEVVRNERAAQEYVVELADGPAADAEERYAARVLATIVGDDSGSRFFWALVDSGRAECASLSSYEFQGAGIFLTYLCCPPERAAENLAAIRQIENELEREGVDERELELAKSKITAHIALRSELPIHRLFAVGHAWLQRREYRTIGEIIARYRDVTRDDLASVLERFPLSRASTVAVGQLDELPAP